MKHKISRRAKRMDSTFSIYSDEGSDSGYAVSHIGPYNDSTPQRVPMQNSERCDWHLLKMGDDDYSVQYGGPEPNIRFPHHFTGRYQPVNNFANNR
jgi:hypothetical protein